MPVCVGLPLQGQTSYLFQLPTCLSLHHFTSSAPEPPIGQSQLGGNRQKDEMVIYYVSQLTPIA